MFKKLKIGGKLALMVAAPIIVVLYLSITSLLSEIRAANQASNIKEAVNLSVVIGNFVHESQKERGRTAAFVSKSGDDFRHRTAGAADRDR